MSGYSPGMVSAVKALKTATWGGFFFVMPVVVKAGQPVPSIVLTATTARVVLPDADITRSEPLYGAQAWEDFGCVGLKNYRGVLIPLAVVRELNPEFDYKSVLTHCTVRPEHEQVVAQGLFKLQRMLRRG